MIIPLHYVFLNTLGEIDLLALLALAQASRTLSEFIFTQVIAVSHLCGFLQQHQCALLHDDRRLHFSNLEVSRLHCAFAFLQRKHGDALFQSIFPYIGPLISRVPSKVFFRSRLPSTEFLDTYTDFFGITRDRCVGAESVRQSLKYLFENPWTYFTKLISDAGPYLIGRVTLNEMTRHPVLETEVLFCKNYLNHFNICERIIASQNIKWYIPIKAGEEGKIVAAVEDIGRQCMKYQDPFRFALEKWCLQSFLEPAFRTWRQIPLTTFRAIFELERWRTLWTKAELGRWLSMGLTSFGGAGVGYLIDQCFHSTCESLVWLFLGAHNWFRRDFPRGFDAYEYSKISKVCCNTPSESLQIGSGVWLSRGCNQVIVIQGQEMGCPANCTTSVRIWSLPESRRNRLQLFCVTNRGGG
jgi:hypothetical protein